MHACDTVMTCAPRACLHVYWQNYLCICFDARSQALQKEAMVLGLHNIMLGRSCPDLGKATDLPACVIACK